MTTKKDFKIFKKECKKWIKYFGLKNWDVKYTHKEDSGSYACYYIGLESRGITLQLCKDIPRKHRKPSDIRKYAFHEVVESMIVGPLKALAKGRYANEGRIEGAGHDIVRILENTIFEESNA